MLFSFIVNYREYFHNIPVYNFVYRIEQHILFLFFIPLHVLFYFCKFTVCEPKFGVHSHHKLEYLLFAQKASLRRTHYNLVELYCVLIEPIYAIQYLLILPFIVFFEIFYSEQFYEFTSQSEVISFGIYIRQHYFYRFLLSFFYYDIEYFIIACYFAAGFDSI